MGVRGDIKGYINFTNEIWYDLFRLSGKGKKYIIKEDADELCLHYEIEEVRVGCGGSNPVAYCELVPFEFEHLDFQVIADEASFRHPCWAYIHDFLHDFLMCGVDEIKHRGKLDKSWLDTIWSEFELNDEAFDAVLDDDNVEPDADDYMFENGEWVSGFSDAFSNANPYAYALDAYASIDEEELREWAGEDWEDEVEPIYRKIKELHSNA